MHANEVNRNARQAGVTLAEVLTVFAIVLIIAAISFPVYLSSRAKGYEVRDISNLKQLGTAGALYNEASGAFPDSTTPLVELKYVPKELVASGLDPHSEGLANVVVKDLVTVPFDRPENLTKYKNSYPGLREFCISDIWADEVIRNRDGGGWLIELSAGKDDPALATNGFRTGLLNRTGKYKRLLYDTSVALRNFKDGIGIVDGKKAGFRSSSQLFTDEPKAYGIE